MTVADIENASRKMLQDTIPPYRWTSEDMRGYLAEAITHLHSIRPESRYVNCVLTDFAMTSETVSIPIDERWKEALAYYVVYKCYLVDDTDTVNLQLAETYLGKAEKWMQL